MMMSNRTSYRVNVTDVGLDMVIVFSSPIGGWDGLFKIMPDPTAPATQYTTMRVPTPEYSCFYELLLCEGAHCVRWVR